jgi:hypothetical protein
MSMDPIQLMFHLAPQVRSLEELAQKAALLSEPPQNLRPNLPPMVAPRQVPGQPQQQVAPQQPQQTPMIPGRGPLIPPKTRGEQSTSIGSAIGGY